MYVTVVNETPMYPMSAGPRLRTLNLLLRLARNHRITVFFRAGPDTSENEETLRFLRENGMEGRCIGTPPAKKSGPGFYASLARNVFADQPYNAALHNCPELRKAIHQHALSNHVDLWQFEWLSYVDAVPQENRAPRIVDAHDVVSTLWYRHLETARNPLKRWYVGHQLKKVLRFESSTLKRADRVVAVSDADAATFVGRYGFQHVDVVENGMDRSLFEAVVPQRDPRCILFMGVLDSLPNLDGVSELLGVIFPKVRAALPEAKLLIVGRNPPKWLVDRCEKQRGVELHKNVPDVRPFLAKASVLAVPLRIGSGSRLKILEALGSALPVVSTKLGAEGLALKHGKDLVIADTPREIASALIDCLRNPQRAQDIARRGQRVVLEQYDWSVLASKLEGVWERCIAQAAMKRKREANVSLQVNA